jgi:hypothetical protein
VEEYETVRVPLKGAGIVLKAVPSTPSRVPLLSMPSKKAIEETRENLGAGEIFYYSGLQ